MPRLPFASRTDFDAQDQRCFDEIVTRWPRVIDLHLLMANAPNVASPLLEVSQQLRASSDLPLALRELAILRTTRLNDAQYEVTRHTKNALVAGVEREQLAELDEFETSSRFDEIEKAVIRLATELHVPPLTVSDATWTTLKAHLSIRGITELLITIGFYHLGSRFERALELEIEPWYEKA